jgi:hypothetical protein
MILEVGVTGETDLASLLRGMSPHLNEGVYVYVMVPDEIPAGARPVVTVREEEGLTLVLSQPEAAGQPRGISVRDDRFSEKLADEVIDLRALGLSHAEHCEVRPEAIDDMELALSDELLFRFAILGREEHIV